LLLMADEVGENEEILRKLPEWYRILRELYLRAIQEKDAGIRTEQSGDAETEKDTGGSKRD